jgi:murein tripeptide amidase MpaA
MSKNLLSAIPAEWQTPAEKTNYRETPRYQETIAYCERLAAASPLIRFTIFGKSGEGRDLPLLIASEGDTFTPESAREADKPIVLIQACIHAGEPDGKDAGLALLRDIAITKTHAHLLKQVVVLFMPMYNADGHERFGPFNRINQNGPAQMGWRTTTAYLNLNRDYMKADAPETRSWLQLWNNWRPDLFIDCHVTDGADYRYNITYHHEHHDGVPPSVLAWEQDVFDARVPTQMEAEGNVVSWYLEFKDNRDFAKGIVDFSGSPRFSTGYTPLRNRPGILIETHMLKEYEPRVRGTYDLLRFALEEVNADPERLLTAGRLADEMAASYRGQSGEYPLTFELTDKAIPYQLKAVESFTEESWVSGAQRVVFGTEPLDITVPMYRDFKPRISVAPPLYYIVPPQWQAVIAVLQAHGLTMQYTTEPGTIEIESYRFMGVSLPSATFEGRTMPSFETVPVVETRTFPAGSVVVPLAQAGAPVALHLLEPQAPDSFVAWGFFNAVFEQKEYSEDYVSEKLAREMMSADPALRLEFEERLANDASFAASPHQRLQFFYMQSPYWDPELNLYPVGRITQELRIPLKSD